MTLTVPPTTHDEAVDALQAFAVLPDWLSALMEPGRLDHALRRSVAELADGRLTLVSCRADRLRAKGEDWLARCSVTVADRDGTRQDVVLVGFVLPPPRRPASPTEAVDQRVVPFGAPGWQGYLEDLGLQVRVQEADEGLPALESLLDPVAAAATIGRCLRAGPRPGARVTGCEPFVARYKPGSRCTIVYRVRYAESPGSDSLPDPVVAKTHQGDKGLVAHEAMTALWNTALADGKDVLLAEPLGYLAGERVLLQGPVPEERTLKELARQAFPEQEPAGLDAGPLAELRTELEKTAAALAALHGSVARYSRTATWQGELAEVREVLDRLTLSVPGLRTAAEPMLARLEELDRKVPADPLVSAHHDFRPAQVLLHSGRVGFIDFDGAAMAEPALDLGRFRGKLRDIGISAFSAAGGELDGQAFEDRLALLDDLCEHFLAAYQAHAPVSRERVLLWETIDLLTALLHTWTKVRLLRVGPRLAVLVHQMRTAHG
ncbi:MAG: phosphotransferase [Actinomycetes bacterium]